MFAGLLTAFMTYPLYVINLSFVLENMEHRWFSNFNHFYNYLQFFTSLLVLCVTPFNNFFSTAVSNHVKHGIDLTLKDKIKVFCCVCVCVCVCVFVRYF